VIKDTGMKYMAFSSVPTENPIERHHEAVALQCEETAGQYHVFGDAYITVIMYAIKAQDFVVSVSSKEAFRAICSMVLYLNSNIYL